MKGCRQSPEEAGNDDMEERSVLLYVSSCQRGLSLAPRAV